MGRVLGFILSEPFSVSIVAAVVDLQGNVFGGNAHTPLGCSKFAMSMPSPMAKGQKMLVAIAMIAFFRHELFLQPTRVDSGKLTTTK